MSGSLDKPRVLIIDDDADNLLRLTQGLSEEFFLLLAHDATRGWELAHGDPAPDVIVIDTVLPGMGGFELCSRLTAIEELKPAPVILIGSGKNESEELQALEAGSSDLIFRPLSLDVIKLKLRRQLSPKSSSPFSRQPQEAGKLQTNSAASADPEVERLAAEVARQKEALELLTSELQIFSYSVSHDLRAPLRHLVGFSDALLEDHRAELEGTALLYLDCIGKAARKMESQVEALLMLSRVTAQEMVLSAVDLSSIARDCAATLQATAPQRKATFAIEENLTARADVSLIRTALRHLFDNAWKFSAPKDPATIVFGRGEGDGTFFVRDNGVGFDMQYSSRLFGPFQRLHQEGEFEGIGIGLAVVRRIIGRHGGKVWAEAKVGEGATFYFTLPA